MLPARDSISVSYRFPQKNGNYYLVPLTVLIVMTSLLNKFSMNKCDLLGMSNYKYIYFILG